MKKVNLGTIWCAYQPPVQLKEIVQKVNRECYSPIFNWLAHNKGLKVNIAINKSLSELLIKNKCTETLDNLGIAAENGSVELMGGFAYHPFSPLVIQSEYGKDELKRQNELNNSFNKKIFNKSWNPKGFYLPEFGYSDEVGKLVKELGYKYAVTNALLYAEKNKKPQPFSKIARVNGLDMFFSSDWSKEFAVSRPNNGDCDTRNLINDMFSGMCGWFGDKDGYTVWGYDIETIGHQQKGYGVHTLEAMVQGIKEHDMESVFLSDLPKMFPEKEEAEIFAGTQSTSFWDISRGEFFSLWNDPNNQLHKTLWNLEGYAMNVINETAKISNRNGYKIARDSIDRGLNSCKTWQANRYNPSGGGFIPWIVIKGADYLVDGINGCCVILKDTGKKIRLDNELVSSDEILRKAKEFGNAVLNLV